MRRSLRGPKVSYHGPKDSLAIFHEVLVTSNGEEPPIERSDVHIAIVEPQEIDDLLARHTKSQGFLVPKVLGNLCCKRTIVLVRIKDDQHVVIADTRGDFVDSQPFFRDVRSGPRNLVKDVFKWG